MCIGTISVCGLIFGVLAGFDLAVSFTMMAWYIGLAFIGIQIAGVPLLCLNIIGTICGALVFGFRGGTKSGDTIQLGRTRQALGALAGFGLGLLAFIYLTIPSRPVLPLMFFFAVLGALSFGVVDELRQRPWVSISAIVAMKAVIGALAGLGWGALTVTFARFVPFLGHWVAASPLLVLGAVCGAVVARSGQTATKSIQTVAWWCATTMGVVAAISLFSLGHRPLSIVQGGYPARFVYTFFTTPGLAVVAALLGIAIGCLSGWVLVPKEPTTHE
jgi:hypothetical protein